MNKFSLNLVLAASLLALTGCAISGGGPETVPVASSSANPNPSIETASVADLTAGEFYDPSQVALSQGQVPEKFQQSDLQMLRVDEPDTGLEGVAAEIENAYAAADANQPVITTEHASLKPFVGRWTLEKTGTRGKVHRIGSYLGLADECEIVLEDVGVGFGYKAKGSSACPTSLFMLDSWVAYDGQLVLRDHMGDEIVKLRSRDGGVFVGVNKEGRTLILNKS